MDAAALATLSRLLDEALAREPGARTAWLESLGPEYDAVKPRLLRLLSDLPELRTSGFLGTLPKLDAPSHDEEPYSADREPAAGVAIGPYRLVRAVAEGGMGSVWLAERTDGMVNRPVALKLPRGAWHRRGISERMARERDILAALNHPNIARLYDAGLTADGQPYLALEYVEGHRIDEYCRVTGLDVGARVHLVLQVAQALVHAHAKLIVHRDLKPSNILVTADGEVRLLDFGIATLLEEGLAKDSTLTALSGRAFTPEYASPEQVAGVPLGVVSDVYSLGVVLYELLTGTRPYQLTHDSAAALEAAILDADVRRPSEAADDPKARRAMRGDLDTIVLTCLKKRPDDRYATMDALVDDLERYLNKRPVLAQPDSRWYRARKFVSRNRLVVAATAATVVAILAGATGAVIGLVRATRAEAAAKQESTTARQVSAFLTGLFGASDPNARGTTTLTELLDRGAKRIELDLRGQPEVQAGLFETLSHVYGSLGLHRNAVTLAEKSLALDAAGSHETLQTAEASMTLGRSAWALGDFERARQAFERALATRTRLVGEDDLGVAAALNQLGGLHGQQERFDEAIAAHTRALAIQRRVRGPDDIAVTNSLRGLGIVHSRRKDYATALGLQQQVLAIYRKTYGDEHAITADGYEGVAIYLRDLNRFAEAHPPAERSLEIRKSVLPPNHPATAFSYDTLGELLMAEGRLDAAVPPLTESLRIREAALGANNPRTADSLASLGRLRLRRGDFTESRLLLERALAIYERAYGSSHSKTTQAREGLSLARARLGAQPAPTARPSPR